MQRFTFASDGTIRIGGKCVDVADRSTQDMAAVQIYACNNTGARAMGVHVGRRHRQSTVGKCADIGGWNAANGAPPPIWTCNGFANQI
jgi:Ricin-type beta-trefoil lectin domain